MSSTARVTRFAVAGTLIAAATATAIGATTTGAQTVVGAPFTFDVYDSDDDAALNLSPDGRFLYTRFVGQPMRVDIGRGTSEASGAFGDGVLSGQVSFVDTGTPDDSFTRLTRSGGATSIERLPWVASGSSILSADGFGRYVVPDSESATIHDTQTGLVWRPGGPFDTVRPAGPNSLSADGNTAVVITQNPRCCPPFFATFDRVTGSIRELRVEFAGGTPEAAISANARYVAVPVDRNFADVGFFRIDIVTGVSVFVAFGDTPGGPTDKPTQVSVGNDGQVFWVSNGHAFRWLESTGDIEQIDVSTDGDSADAAVQTLLVSDRGDRVAFTSAATNLDASPGCCGADNVITYVGTAQPPAGYVRAASAISAVGVHPKMAEVSWGATTTSGVTGYAVLRNGVEVAQSIDTDGSLAGLPSGNSYFQVQAFAPSTGDDGGIRRSVRTPPAKVKIDYDASRPTVPTDLVAEFDSDPRQGTFDLEWSASSDNSNVVRYAVYDKNVLLTMVDQPSVRLRLPFGDTHYFQVRAIDLNGNQSVKTSPVFIEN